MGKNSMLNIAVAGASGRMGRMLVETLDASEGVQLSGALDIPGSPLLGRDAGEMLGVKTGVIVTADLTHGLQHAQVLIDFTRPEGTLQHLNYCVAHGIKMVIGTTGFDEAGKAAIAEAAKKTALVFAPNMSVGVNATLKLLDMAARILNSGYDVEVFEAHHHHKVDAPSGTALKMGEVVADAWGKKLDDVVTWTRHGHTGARKPGEIGFSVVRGGDIVGDHTVYFCGVGERIEITHRSSSRAGYAEGSLRAARYLEGKKTGLFNMQTVLGL
jgi:4-hydroxy-tetrahydrodipicolinate reductase